MAGKRATHRGVPDPNRKRLTVRRPPAPVVAPVGDTRQARWAAGVIAAVILVLVVVVALVHVSGDTTSGAPGAAGQAFPTLRSASPGAGGSTERSPSAGRSASPAPSGTSSSTASPAPGEPSSTLRATPAQQVGDDAEEPRMLRLPDGTDVPVLAVGTTGGQLNVPDDIRNAGWWKGGARIGDPFGAMLIAAHVDSLTQGLGPYAQLLSARPGQKVVVSSARLTENFVLRSRRVVSRDSLPDQDSIFSATGPTRLVMVTCSGPYIKSEGGYQNLAILTATPQGRITTR